MTLTAFKANLPNALPDNTVGGVEVADVRNQLLALAEEVEDGAQIASIYEGEDDTNKFTDAEKAKLSAIAMTPDQFGAVGDGVTDDLTAFQTMIAAIGSRGARIFIPPKSYYLSGNLDIFNTSILMGGVPSSATTNGSRLLFAANRGLRLANNDGSVIENLRIDGPTSGTAAGALIIVGKLTEAAGCDYCAFQNVQTNGGYRSLWLQKSLETRFLNCRFTGATGIEAVLLSGGVAAADYTVDAAEFVQTVFSGSNTTDCIHLNGAANSVQMTQCVVLFGHTGLKYTDAVGAGDFPKFFYFSDGGFENQASYCVFVDGLGDDIKFTNAYFSNDSATLDAIYIGADDATLTAGTVMVSNSTIRGAGRDGVRILGMRARIRGNDIINNGRAVTGDGVHIGAAVTNAVVADNHIGSGPDGTNNSRWAILNNSTPSSTVQIHGNFGDGGSSGTLGGTATTGTGIRDNF